MAYLNFLAHDLGASNGRTILGRYDGAKITLSELNRFENQHIRVGEHYYWDVLRLFSCLKGGISAYSKAVGEPLSGIGIDTWGVDFGLLDRDGNLIGNPRSYRDPRGLRGMKAFHQKYGEKTAFDMTGVANLEFNTLYQLYDMACCKDPQLEIADKLLLIPDLLGYMLSGTISSEYTNATTTQMLDADSGMWSKDILKMMGIKPELLIDIQMSGETKGQLLKHIAEETGLGECPPIINVGSHDTASAVASIPVKDYNFAFLSSGTWSLMGILRDKALINNAVYLNRFSNEGAIDGGVRLLQNIMGLWVIQNCKKEWDRQNVMSWDEIVGLAEAAPAFRSYVDINAHTFFEASHMPQKIQQYCEDTYQRIPQTKGEIARTVYESLAMSYKDAFYRLEQLKGRRIDALHIVGGGAQNSMLNQLTANAINRPVFAGPIEATAIGNLMVQIMSTGELNGIDDIREVITNSFNVRYFEPKDTEQWLDKYEVYRKTIHINN